MSHTTTKVNVLWRREGVLYIHVYTYWIMFYLGNMYTPQSTIEALRLMYIHTLYIGTYTHTHKVYKLWGVHTRYTHTCKVYQPWSVNVSII